jgi:hypothetical protein
MKNAPARGFLRCNCFVFASIAQSMSPIRERACVDRIPSEAEARADDRSEGGIRPSPFDPWITALCVLSARPLPGRYGGRASGDPQPARFSILHMTSAAALSKAGRMDEASPAVERALQLHPTSAVADNASPSALSQRSPRLLLKRCALRDCRTSDVS